MIYRRLCPDVQGMIRSYFHPYERHGMVEKQVMQWCDAKKRNIYYKKIRYCPRGWKWAPRYHEFYYRRQNHHFQWFIEMSTFGKEDVWDIRMYGQWNPHMSDEKLYTRLCLYFEKECLTLPPYRAPDGVYMSTMCCEFTYRVDHADLALKTRQAYLLVWTDLVMHLSKKAESMWSAARKRQT